MSTKRMKSWVWGYAKILEDGKNVQCNICDSVLTYGGSPSTINKHLTRKHSLTKDNEDSLTK